MAAGVGGEGGGGGQRERERGGGRGLRLRRAPGGWGRPAPESNQRARRRGGGQWARGGRSGREMAAAAAAAAALERLEELACPQIVPLVSLEPAEALSLLCTPSAQRLDLLEWLCSRVHPDFAACLEALQDGPVDARLQEVARLGAELMLCRADDMDLVEGTAPPEQQLEFIGDLLDAAPLPEDEIGVSTLECTTEFLREVLETPEGAMVLDPPDPPPLPTFDAYESSPPRWVRGTPPPTLPPPGGGTLESDADRHPPSGPALEAMLAEVRQRLEQLEAQSPELGGSQCPAPPALPALGVAGCDLAALATAFRVSELQDPWGQGGSQEPPALAPCGPLAPPVCQGMQQLVQSLSAVAQLDDTVAEVTRLAGGGKRQAMETQVATLQQRFGDVPKAKGPPQN